MRIGRPICLAIALALVPVAAGAQISTVERCVDTWKEADADDDGIVSTREAQRAGEAAYALMDSNNDDKVSREEWQACMSPEGAAIGTAPAAPGAGGN